MPFDIVVTRRARIFFSVAFAQAVFATVASLYLSEIARFAPCALCWYQRILIFPLVIIFFVGFMFHDEARLAKYVLPFSLLGIIVALYHVLLQTGRIPGSSLACTLGVSCVEQQITWFGFVTIPFLSFCAFVAITVFTLLGHNALERRDK